MTDKKNIEADARGQYAKSQANPKNAGFANAIPTKVVHEDDPPLHKSGEKPSPYLGFDIRTQTNKRD